MLRIECFSKYQYLKLEFNLTFLFHVFNFQPDDYQYLKTELTPNTTNTSQIVRDCDRDGTSDKLYKKYCET